MILPLKNKAKIYNEILPQTYTKLEKLSDLEKEIKKFKKKKDQWEIKRVANKAKIMKDELADYIPFGKLIFNQDMLYIPKPARNIIKWAEKYAEKYWRYFDWKIPK